MSGFDVEEDVVVMPEGEKKTSDQLRAAYGDLYANEGRGFTFIAVTDGVPDVTETKGDPSLCVYNLLEAIAFYDVQLGQECAHVINSSEGINYSADVWTGNAKSEIAVAKEETTAKGELGVRSDNKNARKKVAPEPGLK
ncbi:MAG: hypothetical protein PHE27_08765 [Alphaproteobacteria bacterium]|nr:hypothetical protein [Alphaproteobacteria bacterium]